jgi:hypothetical protein
MNHEQRDTLPGRSPEQGGTSADELAYRLHQQELLAGIVEMLFAHLKTTLRFERMRLRGLTGASDEFHLAPWCRTYAAWLG